MSRVNKNKNGNRSLPYQNFSNLSRMAIKNSTTTIVKDDSICDLAVGIENNVTILNECISSISRLNDLKINKLQSNIGNLSNYDEVIDKAQEYYNYITLNTKDVNTNFQKIKVLMERDSNAVKELSNSYCNMEDFFNNLKTSD